MPRFEVPFAQGFYISESLPISAQECVNFYPSVVQTNAEAKVTLFGTPGLIEKATAGTAEFNRGAHVLSDVPYFVNGGNLYRLDRTIDAFGVASFTAVKVNGAVTITGSKTVSIADNGTQMCIVDPTSSAKFNAWIYVEGVGLTQVSDADFDGPASAVVFVDGFFLFTKKDGQKFFVSALRDGLTYNALDFASAEVDPDPIRAPFVLKNQVFIFGSQTVETFQNIGGSGFPFQRINGQVLQKGILAALSVTEVQGAMAWVGSSVNEGPAIWISSGAQPKRISTRAIENQLRTFTDQQIEDAIVLKYSQAGSYFVAWTFPGQATFVYDTSSQLWHERSSRITVTDVVWRPASIVDAYGELIVGDTFSNKIGFLDKETFTEYTEDIIGVFSMPPIDNDGQPYFMDSIELFMESGNALTTGQGSDPEIRMSFSDNGGRTFSNSISRNIGKIGEFNTRVMWNRLGRVARQRIFKFQISEPIKRVIIKAEANIES